MTARSVPFVDAEIPEEPNLLGSVSVTLWRVVGIAGKLYPTKMAAEVAARLQFPDEGPDERYARVFYRRFILED